MFKNEQEKFWIAGILEGEGSFLKGPPTAPNLPIIQVQMTDEDIIKRVADVFGKKYYNVKSKKNNWKDSFVFRIKGRKAVEIMRELKSIMGVRRQGQINNAIQSFDFQRIILSEKEKEEVVKLAENGNMTQKQIGNMFNCSREHVNKLYAAYKKSKRN